MGVEGAVGSGKKVGDSYLSCDDSYTNQRETIFDIHVMRFISHLLQVAYKVSSGFLFMNLFVAHSTMLSVT